MEKPATPLPWSIEKCRCGHRSCDQWVFRHAGSVGLYGDDARYAVHACNAYPHLTAINAELVACLEVMTEFAEGVIRIKRLTDTNGIVAASRAALARAKENSQ